MWAAAGALVWFLVGTQANGDAIRLGPFTTMQCTRLKVYLEREVKAQVQCERDFRWEKETMS